MDNGDHLILQVVEIYRQRPQRRSFDGVEETQRSSNAFIEHPTYTKAVEICEKNAIRCDVRGANLSKLGAQRKITRQSSIPGKWM